MALPKSNVLRSLVVASRRAIRESEFDSRLQNRGAASYGAVLLTNVHRADADRKREESAGEIRTGDGEKRRS